MRRGFTAVELAIVLSISALLVPAAYSFLRGLETELDLAKWHLETAEQVRTLNEQLARDQRDPCHVHYELKDGAVLRQASASCGGEQVVARGVSQFERVAGGVEVTFTLRLNETWHRDSDVFFPLEAP